MKRAYSMREYTDGDQQGILELTKAVHGVVRGEEQWMRWWRWMYKDSPAGTGRIWLAKHNAKIVGQYALVPKNIKVGNKILKAYQNNQI